MWPKNDLYRYFWMLPVVIFFFLFAPNLLREGMFVDGLWYAAISNNLAQDIGSFWTPSFTETIYPYFYEHPPLAFWMQSLFFKLFGEHFFVERLYCFLVFIVTGWLIHLIWKSVFSEKPTIASLGFLPVSFWMLNTGIFFAYPNNVLECTMTLFLLSSILVLLKSVQTHRFNALSCLYIVLAGICITLGFLTKGFVALFPLVFYGIYQIAYKTGWKRNLIGSMILAGTFFILILLILQNPEARTFFDAYLNGQVIAALDGQRTENLRESRFFLLIGLLNSFFIVGIVCALLIGVYYGVKKRLRASASIKVADKKIGFLFLLIGFSGSLPLLISLKQAGYYLVPSISLFSIAIGVFMVPIVSELIHWLSRFATYRKLLFGFGITLLFVGIAQALVNLGTVDKRDRERIAIVKEVAKIVPKGELLSSDMQSFDHSLHGFFQRYHGVALDTVRENIYDHTFILSDSELNTSEVDYSLIKMIDATYLYQRNK